MDKRITKLIIVMIALCFLFAEGSYDILNLPQNARSLALNNTTSANDGSFLQNNPAVLSLRSRGTTYSYFYLPASIHFGGVQHIGKLKAGIMSSKLSFLSYGKIVDSETEETASAFDILFEMGYKKEIKNITSIGMSGGYIFSSIAGFHSQLLFSNWGVRSRLLKKRVGIGLSLENIGIHLKSYTDVNEPIPALFRTAVYYKPMYIPLIINGDIVRKLDSNSFYFSGGLEFISQRRLTFRLGINSNRGGYHTEDFSSDIIAGVSGGIGFQFQKITLDIGFINWGPAGFIMGFSITNKQN